MTTSAKPESRAKQPKQRLQVPTAQPARFNSSYIQTAACELRFPTLLDFAKERPVEFQRVLRAEFPHYEHQRVLQIPALGGQDEDGHIFRSRDRKTAIVFRPSAIIVETSDYKGFEHFNSCISLALAAADKVVDVDFFSRVGLRYINAVPLGEVKVGELGDWIRPELVQVLDRGIFGTLSRYWQEIIGAASDGEYSFRHGIRTKEDTQEPAYVLDFDFFDADIDRVQASRRIAAFHVELFSFFVWCLGSRTLDTLKLRDK